MTTDHKSTFRPSEPRLIVFSDLDGTLLEHDSYSWAPARPALDQMKALGIPLILASSKTAAEIAELRAEMGFDHAPAIVENGAGVLAPGAAPVQDRSAYEAIRAALAQLPTGLRSGFTGFSDWTVEEVAKQTGLPLPQAERAAQRQFSEPGIWTGTEQDKKAFQAALGSIGITARAGGRYLTLSFGATKADRMASIAAGYSSHAVTMALGDAPNDVEMIETADYGAVVLNVHGPGIPELAGEATGRVVRTGLPGPRGWNIAVRARIAQEYHEQKEG